MAWCNSFGVLAAWVRVDVAFRFLPKLAPRLTISAQCRKAAAQCMAAAACMAVAARARGGGQIEEPMARQERVQADRGEPRMEE